MRLADALYLVPRLGFDACSIQAGYRLRRKLGKLEPAFPTPSWDEAGLGRFVSSRKDGFIGREALIAARERGSGVGGGPARAAVLVAPVLADLRRAREVEVVVGRLARRARGA